MSLQRTAKSLLFVLLLTPLATQVYAQAPPALPTGSTGIAASYPNDASIQNHPSVLFADGFETYTSTSQLTSSGKWTNYYQGSNIALDSSAFFGGTKAIRLRVPTTTAELHNAIEKQLSPEQDTLFTRVYTRFQPDYSGLVDAHNGITISGHYPGPGSRPNGRDFFLVLIENSRSSEPQPGYTHAYVYHPEQDDSYGEHWFPDGTTSNGAQNFGPYFVVRPKVIPARGAWVCYEVMVKLNTPGSRDGRVAVWQDGALIADWQNLRFRDVATLKIDKIAFGNGGKSSPQQNDKWYDNLVVATSYVGPTATTGTADTTAPSVPTGLSATAVSSSQINLSWNASTDNVGVTGYDIYRGGTLLTSVTGTTYSNTGLTAGTAYSYAVRAKDAAGNNSGQSTAASATTQSGGSTTYTLSISKSGTGTVTGTGINCGSDCSQALTSGSQVALTASPATGFTFAGWSGGGCSGTGTCSVTLSANTTVTANFESVSTGGRTFTAASCSRNDVQAAINQHLASPADGDIISIPAGTCTWTTSISATFTRSVTIRGAGAISSTDRGASTTGTDQTTIIDNHPTSHHQLLQFSTTAGKSFRFTGIAVLMNGSGTQTNNGVLAIYGSSTAVRIDHSHFYTTASSSIIKFYGRVLGVTDHCYFDSPSGVLTTTIFFVNGQTWDGDTTGWGDKSWADGDHWGTDRFMFVEDCRFFNSDLGDSHDGARYVYRYNTATANNTDRGWMHTHGLNNDRARGTRAAEFYNNNFSQPSGGGGNEQLSYLSGTLLYWGNTVSQYKHAIKLAYRRASNGTYNYGSVPSNWGNCDGKGLRQDWDGPGSGYPCLDFPTRGAGDLLTGNFSNVVNARTGNRAWPQQALSPLYVWSNSFTGSSSYGGSATYLNMESPATANRDYYQQTSGFNGSAGVGVGLLSARPSTCTAGPGGNTPGVGYWATDQNTLYVCTATNAWTAYYTPYAYPHPLTLGTTGGTTSPAAPTNLFTSVQ